MERKVFSQAVTKEWHLAVSMIWILVTHICVLECGSSCWAQKMEKGQCKQKCFFVLVLAHKRGPTNKRVQANKSQCIVPSADQSGTCFCPMEKLNKKKTYVVNHHRFQKEKLTFILSHHNKA
uniref:Uncharacterized protein n=1 Tax=Strigamia maritima TaxID=126957 RepID=T1JC35_STRMM